MLMDVDLLNIDTSSIAALEDLQNDLESNGMQVTINPLQLYVYNVKKKK